MQLILKYNINIAFELKNIQDVPQFQQMNESLSENISGTCIEMHES